MWTLVVVFVVSGGSFTVPGFSTAEKCKAAQLQTIDELNNAFAKFGLAAYLADQTFSQGQYTYAVQRMTVQMRHSFGI